MNRSARALFVVAGIAILVGGFGALPAGANPSPRVSNVYQLPCEDDDPVCDGDDQPLADGGTVDAAIQVHLSVTSPSGLQWVELRARYGTSSEVCLRHWDTSATSFNTWYDWSTGVWPGQPGEPPDGCAGSDSNGDVTRNGSYFLRVVARDSLGTANSSDFEVRVKNAAEAPSWSASPRQNDPDEGRRDMELRWFANTEPDLVEYRWTRRGPDGESTYEVYAPEPGRQGCDVDGDEIVCWDEDFPERGYDGNYSYELTAWRRSPSGSACRTTSGTCVGSATSDEVSGRLDEPPPPEPESTPEDEGSPSSRPRPRGSTPAYDRDEAARVYGRTYDATDRFYFGKTYEGTLPYGTQQGFRGSTFGAPPASTSPSAQALADPDPDAPDPRRLWVFLASGLLLLVGAVHLSRLARNW